MSMARNIILCGAFLLPELMASQMPATVSKLQITSTPPNQSILIVSPNNAQKQAVTPITVGVLPGTYKVKIGNCAQVSIKVNAGETKKVSCPPGSQ